MVGLIGSERLMEEKEVWGEKVTGERVKPQQDNAQFPGLLHFGIKAKESCLITGRIQKLFSSFYPGLQKKRQQEIFGGINILSRKEDFRMMENGSRLPFGIYRSGYQNIQKKKTKKKNLCW